MIARRRSIESITEVKATGQRPVVVSCDDFCEYLCKYAVGFPANILATEWVCTHSARAFGLLVPDIALVDISVEHHPDTGPIAIIPSARLDVPSIGFKYLQAKEVDRQVELVFQVKSERDRILDKLQLLEIALFDIWIANEDRHAGNYNLLLARDGGKYSWYVIDHGAAFNTLAALNHGLYELTFQDSVLASPLLKTVFQKPPNFARKVESVVESFRRMRPVLQETVRSAIRTIPQEWEIDRVRWELFSEELCSDQWGDRVIRTFQAHCHSMHAL